MKYCNRSDCSWNDRNGICTYFEFEDMEEGIDTRLCCADKTPTNIDGDLKQVHLAASTSRRT